VNKVDEALAYENSSVILNTYVTLAYIPEMEQK
jgi:hypothetical protein